MINFFLDAHGCAKNQVDAEILISLLEARGIRRTLDSANADLIIINSCGFIESAKKESIDAVLAARRVCPSAKILLCGCLAERYAEELQTSLPEADGFFGNGDLTKIVEAADDVLAGKRPILKPRQAGVCSKRRSSFLSSPASAYVKITEGCNNRCSFCAIPLIRGALRSRPARDIVAEIEELASRGVYEIILIGQDLAAYGTGADDDVFGTGRFPLPRVEGGVNFGTEKESALAKLLNAISALKGDFVVRLLYMHPDHFNRDILPVMQGDARLLPYFDIPFQSGSDKIIKSMNRRCSSDEYLRLVRDIRKAFPAASLRTTFLTGFPGETDEDAKATLDFLDKIQSDWAGSFCYSREEETPACDIKPRVPKKIAAARADAIMAAQEKITAARLNARLGKEYDALVEEIIDSGGGDGNGEDEGLAIARAWFQAPDVDGSVVVRYDKSDAAQNNAVKPGAVVRVFADKVSGVDVGARFVGATRISATN